MITEIYLFVSFLEITNMGGIAVHLLHNRREEGEGNRITKKALF